MQRDQRMSSFSPIKDTSGQDTAIEPRQKHKKAIVTWLAIGVSIVAVLIFILPGLNALFQSGAAVSKRQIQLATVTRGDLTRDVSVQGKIIAAISPTLYAPSGGTVSLTIKAGDTVSKGDVLATIASPELESQYAQQKAHLEELQLNYQRQEIQIKSALLDNQQQIELAIVDLELSEKNKQRADTNIKIDVISQVEYEQHIAELKKNMLQHKHAIEKAELQKENYEFELKSMTLQLDRQKYVVENLERQVSELTIKSPIDGMIGNVFIREKDSVNQNSELLSVVDLTAFEVEVTIPESYADDLVVNLPAQVQYNGERYGGFLSAISPEVINGQVNGIIRFSDRVPEGLRQNQRVSSRIMIESKKDVLKVARGSFVETGGGRIAFVVDGTIALKQPIDIGVRSINEVEITQGLEEGDTIITSSIEQYADHQQIYLTE